jgi:predicted glycosyltransferase
MNFLFDITHPAHVHLFRNAMNQLRAAGHRVLVTSREKDLTNDLLDVYGFEYRSLSAKGGHKLSLLVEWTRRELGLLRVARRFGPDAIVSRLNPPAAHAASVFRCPSVVFDDSEAARLAARLTHPFADLICTPAAYTRDLGPKQRRYDGFHELAYLHPDWFEPDPEPLVAHGVAVDEPYFVLRFVSWGAHHDVGKRGFTDAVKRDLVGRLSDRGEVYITSERALPDDLERYRLPVPPQHVHDLLYYADLYVGDSQTMATEAGVLGTPAVRANSFSGENDMGNFRALEEEYGLIRSTDNPERALALAEELADADTKSEWHRKRERLCEEKIDVTRYIVDTVTEAAR